MGSVVRRRSFGSRGGDSDGRAVREPRVREQEKAEGYRGRFDGQGSIARFLTRNSFGVYVLHAPILVATTRWLHFLSAPVALKFVLASLGGVLASFLIVGVVARRIPGLRAVLRKSVVGQSLHGRPDGTSSHVGDPAES